MVNIPRDFGFGGGGLTPDGSMAVDLVTILHQQVASSGGAVANLAALRLVDDAAADDGAVVPVASLHDVFILSKESSEAVDEITIVSTKSGRGGWLRAKRSSIRWLNQTVWYINSNTGNDENDGSNGNQLKTFAELMRRVTAGSAPATHVVWPKVYIETDLTESEFAVEGRYPDGMEIFGARTVIATGTITSKQDWNAVTSQEGTITDSALPVSWTASGLVGKMIVLSSGANAGAVAWIAKDLGAKTARISPFHDLVMWSIVHPAVADTYEVVNLTKLNGTLRMSTGISWGVFLYDLEVNPSQWSAMDIGRGQAFAATTVLFSGGAGAHRWMLSADTYTLLACRIATSASMFVLQGSVEMYGCFLDGVSFGTRYGYRRYEITSPCLMQGASGLRLRDGGMIKIGSAAWFAAYDMTTHTISLQRNATADISGKIFGTNSSQAGVWMDATSQMIYPDGDNFTAHYAVMTAGDETRVGGVVKTYAAIGVVGYVNPNGGKIVPSETYLS